MAIPDYQTIMLPLLKHLGDGKEKPNPETLDILADEFNLSEEERKELLSSGRQTVFTNRVGWAKVYLKKAVLIDSPKRGYYQITKRGLEELEKDPAKIDNSFLMQFPEFADFIKTRGKGKKAVKGKTKTGKVVIADWTPEDHLEYGYERVREDLAEEVLKRVMECTPGFFEGLVLDLLTNMGYGGSRLDAAKKVGKAGDGGIDGIIKEDRLGLDAIYIQAKRWEGNIGRPEIQKFAGALQGQKAKKGIFITTSSFTREAEDYAGMIDNKIVLIDGEQLANLMIDHDVGVAREASYEVKKIDGDYFTSE